MFNKDKTKEKLKSLSNENLEILHNLILNEQNTRFKFLSNSKNTPREICDSLDTYFNNAWIH